MPSGRRSARHSILVPALLALLLALTPDPAPAFSVFTGSTGDPRPVVQILREAPRWSADERVERSLRDGIEVLVHPSFEEDLGATNPAEVEVVREAVRNAFAAWENPALRFHLSFDSADTLEGASVGGEIDLFTRFANEPPFLLNPTIFGFGDATWTYLPDRLLANGQRADGAVITGGEIQLNATLLRETQAVLGISIEIAALALTRLVMHEIGHTLGFDHPNEGRNFDTDLDPTTGAIVDPSDPFAGILDSPNFLQGAIMSNEPCGGPFGSTGFCLELVFQDLQPDDRLGRDVLYAVPEPESGARAALAALLLGATRRRSAPRRRGESATTAA